MFCSFPISDFGSRRSGFDRSTIYFLLEVTLFLSPSLRHFQLCLQMASQRTFDVMANSNRASHVASVSYLATTSCPLVDGV